MQRNMIPAARANLHPVIIFHPPDNIVCGEYGGATLPAILALSRFGNLNRLQREY